MTVEILLLAPAVELGGDPPGDYAPVAKQCHLLISPVMTWSHSDTRQGPQLRSNLSAGS